MRSMSLKNQARVYVVGSGRINVAGMEEATNWIGCAMRGGSGGR